jgi:choline dehydrogenase
MQKPASDEFDYIVVGSGAGGAPVAARLAEAGMRVLVLEAGSDPRAAQDEISGLPADYDVPAFHTFASENEAMAWSFMVHDFGDDAQRRRPASDPPPGVLYPRASTLGGCTAHNAMIFIAPDDADWEAIADLTGDETWRAKNMRRYFRRLEDCRHRPLWRLLALVSGGRIDPTGHGWRGWLTAETPIPSRAFGDVALMRVIRETIRADLLQNQGGVRPKRLAAILNALARMARFFAGESDPNDRRLQDRLDVGLCELPLSTRSARRQGARERLLAAERTHGLKIEYDALATRVILDGENRAVGVDYLKGRNLYRACAAPSAEAGKPARAIAAREVILAGGAFNSPQLLMLSGVGPADALSALGIKVQVPLDGVGRNLQDRYEIGVIHKAARPWACLKGARFAVDDPVFREWRAGRGMYASNGAAIAFALRSGKHQKIHDLFVMAFLTRFSGYFPGYSEVVRNSRDDITFTILKAHTVNRGGTVSLITGDPRDPPRVDFRYFEEGTDEGGEDLEAVVAGIRRVRRMTRELQRQGVISQEDTPGAELTEADELRQFVRAHAWGHHASCTCAIGEVLTSDFRVKGAKGLRVVDASIFPRIPGFFIACAVYMIGEKAADVILEAARSTTSPRQ